MPSIPVVSKDLVSVVSSSPQALWNFVSSSSSLSPEGNDLTRTPYLGQSAPRFHCNFKNRTTDMELSWQVRAWSSGFSPQHHMKLSTRQHVYKVAQDGKTAHGQRHRLLGLTIRVQSLRNNCQFVLWPTHAHFGRSTPIITHTQWINLYFF